MSVPRSMSAVALLVALLADAVFADPARHHPVAWFGSAAARLERLTYRNTRTAGVVHTVILAGGTTLAAELLARGARTRGPAAEIAVTAFGTWVALGGTTLRRTGLAMADALDSSAQAGGGPDGRDLRRARAILPSLCGRDPSVLDADGLARAATESVAENTSDATVGVLVWCAIAGLPGALGYRAVNTMDSMIGYRSPRYARFGWFAARLDDVVNLVPARLTGVVTVLAAPSVGGSPAAAVRAWRRDARGHPSPNAGVAEAAAAGALGVRLGGPTAYPHGVEIRPTLGSGSPPTTRDLRRASVLSGRVQWGAALISAAAAVAVGEGRRRSRALRPPT